MHLLRLRQYPSFAGIGLQVLQQVCGINTVMYFLVSILSLAGISDNRMALLVAMGPAAVNAIGTIIGMAMIDRAGRRQILLLPFVALQTPYCLKAEPGCNVLDLPDPSARLS